MYFVLDFGGSNLRVSWASSLQEIAFTTNTKKLKNTGDYNADSRDIIDTMISKSKNAKGIVIALPGNFDYQNMVIEYANNLNSWVGQPFFKELKEKLGCNVYVEKDAVVAGIGEGLHNRLEEKDFLYVTWGTGIGGCLVSIKSEFLPKITILNWRETFKQIEELCGGGHAMANFGCNLESINGEQWEIFVSNFMKEVEKICNKLEINTVIIGGGITAKREDIILLMQEELKDRNIKLEKSLLRDFSAIYGGYALLKSFQD